MKQNASQPRVVRALAKGQITIPLEFRRALGIETESLLSVSLAGDHLEITPVLSADQSIRRFSEGDISRFLKEDRLDDQTARRVRDLLKRGEL